MSKRKIEIEAGPIIAIACVIGAVVLLASGINEGWGWLLFIAFCAAEL